MQTSGIKDVYFGFTGRVKAGNSNRKGAVQRSIGQKKQFNNVLDVEVAKALSEIIEIERKIRDKEMEVVRIGNIIRKRRIKREVTN